MYLPIFQDDRVFVFSVLTDAMKKWGEIEKKSQRRDPTVFYEIADTLGKERSRSHIFLGPEAVSEQCLGGKEYACKNALYFFAVDFKEKKIIPLK
ncbi:hypothetical protein [uncultured Methanoregula sp.]|uniref:hypothetical protein n=1 Tax=uncultured Methanoregula sp. TaxID=1005933 RepID=UPI002AAABFB8|nr:hypothetical protein [uncultured Methanoregula sp.]